MIKVDRECLSLSGELDLLVTEACSIVKTLCDKSSRSLVMSTLLSGVYLTPESGKNVDILAGLKSFQEDTDIVLNGMKRLSQQIDGQSIEDAIETMKKINRRKF